MSNDRGPAAGGAAHEIKKIKKIGLHESSQPVEPKPHVDLYLPPTGRLGPGHPALSQFPPTSL